MKNFLLCVAISGLLCAAMPMARAQSLAAPRALVENGDFLAPLVGNWSADGPAAPKLEIVDSAMENAGPFARKNGRLVRLSVTPGTDIWDCRLVAPKTPTGIAAGSVVGVRFWARSPQGARVTTVFQRATEPYDKLINQTAVLTPQWREFRFYSVAETEVAPATFNFEFHLGYGAGTIELADVRAENFGSIPPGEVEARYGAQTVDYWSGAQPDDSWKAAAWARIDKIRKGAVQIRVIDAQGQPIAGAKVSLRQTRSQFRFGSAVVARRLIDTKDADNLRYQSEFARLFNTAVFENDMKWDNTDPQKTAKTLAALSWLQARDIQVRGHNLVWGSRRTLPAEAVALWDDPEALRALVRQHVRDEVTLFKGQVYVWDVVNEAVTNTELWEKLGWDEFANTFKIARETDPNVRLAYNDYNISNESQNPLAFAAQRQKALAAVALLKAKGAPIDIFGDQAHFGLPLTPPARLIEIWNEVGQLGLPIELTELDAGIRDDKVHGAYLRDVLIAAFAQPQIEAVILWGFWEGAHWRGAEGGAMLRRDWSKRPAQLAYEDLVLRQWRTHLTIASDNAGTVRARAFTGDYQITVEANNRTKTQVFKLPASGVTVVVNMG